METDGQTPEVRNVPSFNTDKHLIFSKFEFGDEEDQKLLKKKEKRRFRDLPTGKQYNVLLEKIDKIEKEISSLGEKDVALAEERKKKLLWRKALAKSAGFIVRDSRNDAERLLKKKEFKKNRSKMQWEERLKKVEEQKKKRQKKRWENVKNRKSKKTNKKSSKKK